jgi:hypothetical protein
MKKRFSSYKRFDNPRVMLMDIFSFFLGSFVTLFLKYVQKSVLNLKRYKSKKEFSMGLIFFYSKQNGLFQAYFF